ncbi:hypothetical protein MUK42_30657 [Musa troglodytarum]|uniref:Uncharacterized protein n=1 Tax=Musa troglodytarum TaxID=320322 RepID=A0A9E7FI21_9LILI|nr:hypothetical protein MUK42_30657 [Musa troglodytarum]
MAVDMGSEIERCNARATRLVIGGECLIDAWIRCQGEWVNGLLHPSKKSRLLLLRDSVLPAFLSSSRSQPTFSDAIVASRAHTSLSLSSSYPYVLGSIVESAILLLLITLSSSNRN